MCVVSNMIDSARQQWPPPKQWDYQPAIDFKEIIKRLSAIDKKLGAKDCFDPKKDAYIQELEERIKQLEAVRESSGTVLRKINSTKKGLIING